MSELVKALRSIDSGEWPRGDALCDEAADRIEALEANLRELHRLYLWRFELAKMEKAIELIPFGKVRNQEELRIEALLRQYGTEKKAAWAETAKLVGECLP